MQPDKRNEARYSRIDQEKFFQRLSYTNFTWSIIEYLNTNNSINTTPKMKFFIKDFFSECDQMDWFIYDRNYRNETVKAKNDNNEHLLQIVFKRKTVR